MNDTPKQYRYRHKVEIISYNVPNDVYILRTEGGDKYPIYSHIFERDYEPVPTIKKSLTAEPEQAGGGWISVNDRLPEEFPIFICHEKHKWLAIAKNYADSKMSGIWFKTDMFDLDATHWMPVPDILPKPPAREV